MAATVAVKEANGAGPTWTTKTAIRFCTADAHDPGTDNPIPIPESDFNYSYWKSICLALSDSFTKINNVRFYCDGAIGWNCGTSGGLFVGQRDAGDHGAADGDYEQSAGTEGTTGKEIKDAVNGHDYYKGQTAAVKDVATCTSGSPITVDSGDHTSAERTKHVVLQVKVADDATQGEQTDETLTFKYDEI